MPYTRYPFARRTNQDGTTDSICKSCFVTVGKCTVQDDLKAIEDAHQCDKWRLQVIEAVTSGKQPSQ